MILTVCLFVSTIFTYALLMNMIVSIGKQITKVEESLVLVQSQIMETEQEMVAMRRVISKEDALSKGFIEASEVAYVKVDSIKTAFLNE